MDSISCRDRSPPIADKEFGVQNPKHLADVIRWKPPYEVLPADAVGVPEAEPGLEDGVDILGEDEGAEDEPEDGDEDAEDEEEDGARLEVALRASRGRRVTARHGQLQI